MLHHAGTIDSTYRGEIKVALVNQGNAVQQVSWDERIAQLVFVPVLEADFEVVEEFHATTKGDGGFDSTGEFNEINIKRNRKAKR